GAGRGEGQGRLGARRGGPPVGGHDRPAARGAGRARGRPLRRLPPGQQHARGRPPGPNHPLLGSGDGAGGGGPARRQPRGARAGYGQPGGRVASASPADGKTLISACQDQTVLVWDTASGKRLRELKDCGYAPSLALTRDGRLLAVAGHAGTHTLRLWETTT